MSAPGTIDVAVGVIINSENQVLISLRHPHLHQGNLWEFPGGKLEQGESVKDALQREIGEELGLAIAQCYPLKTIHYQYPDKAVALHVWRITQWQGEAIGLEGQEINWQPLAELDAVEFPAANAPIVKLLQLPSLIAITPAIADFASLDSTIQHLLHQKLALIQLRQPQLSAADYLHWFQRANKLCKNADTTLMFNGDIADFPASGAQAYHANATRLLSLTSRPVADNCLFGASCHNLQELRQAELLQVDFAFLSPVGITPKYANGKPLGWQGFRELIMQVSVPVYGLGGLRRADLQVGKAAGAHGIGGIGMFAGTR